MFPSCRLRTGSPRERNYGKDEAGKGGNGMKRSTDLTLLGTVRDPFTPTAVGELPPRARVRLLTSRRETPLRRIQLEIHAERQRLRILLHLAMHPRAPHDRRMVFLHVERQIHKIMNALSQTRETFPDVGDILRNALAGVVGLVTITGPYRRVEFWEPLEDGLAEAEDGSMLDFGPLLELDQLLFRAVTGEQESHKGRAFQERETGGTASSVGLFLECPHHVYDLRDTDEFSGKSRRGDEVRNSSAFTDLEVRA